MSAYRTAAAAKSLPARCAIRFGELPPDSQEHLRAINDREHLATKRERHTRVYAILCAAAGFFVLIGAGLWSQASKGPYEKLLFDRRTPWDADEITVVTAACFLVGVFLLGGIASLVRQRNAPLGNFWYVHRAYLLDCAHDRVVAHPLALLSDQEVVGETLQLSFGEVDVQIAFDFPAEASAFLLPLRQHATAAAEHLARGTRDEIPGADFIPDALLYRESPKLPWDNVWAKPLFAGVALALAGRLVLPGLHASVAEARFVRACHETPEVCPKYQTTYPSGAHLDDMDDAFFVWTARSNGFASYITSFPKGRHVQEATAAMEDKSTKALERYRKHANAAKNQGDPRLIDAMLTTLEVLHDAHTATLPLRFSGEIDPAISYWNQTPDQQRHDVALVGAPRISGLDYLAKYYALKELRSALIDAVDIPGALDLHEVENAERTDDARAELLVTYRIFKGERVYHDRAANKGPYPEIDIDWTFTFRWPGNAARVNESVTLHTAPAPTFSALVGTSEQVYGGMMQDDAKSLGPALRQALGLPPSPPAE